MTPAAPLSANLSRHGDWNLTIEAAALIGIAMPLLRTDPRPEDQFQEFLISENCFHHAAVYPQGGAIGGRRKFAG